MLEIPKIFPTVARVPLVVGGGAVLVGGDQFLQRTTPFYEVARDHLIATTGIALQHSAVRVGGAIAHHPVAFAAIYGLLLGSVVWWNKFRGREQLLEMIHGLLPRAGEFAERQAPKNLGMAIMAAGLAKASLEMLQHTGSTPSAPYLNAFGDALFASAFIAGIAGCERLSGWGKESRLPFIARASSLAALLATAVCVIDDAVHPMLYLLRSGIFPK